MQNDRGITPFFLFMILVFSVAACTKSSDEEQIKRAIDGLSSAIEENKTAAISEYLHEDFRANGDMNAQQVRQLLLMQGLQHQAISIAIVSAKTMVDPIYSDKAESVLSVITTGSSGGMLPKDASTRLVKLVWRKDRDWKILRADWQE